MKGWEAGGLWHLRSCGMQGHKGFPLLRRLGTQGTDILCCLCLYHISVYISALLSPTQPSFLHRVMLMHNVGGHCCRTHGMMPHDASSCRSSMTTRTCLTANLRLGCCSLMLLHPQGPPQHPHCQASRCSSPYLQSPPFTPISASSHRRPGTLSIRCGSTIKAWQSACECCKVLQ